MPLESAWDSKNSQNLQTLGFLKKVYYGFFKKKYWFFFIFSECIKFDAELLWDSLISQNMQISVF